ncbi:MAG: site-2 protease family protein [Firmicutes bacterium]|jgi:Zn-dependent protease|nr:site-2 protease family protein [Bacillota bacterium]
MFDLDLVRLVLTLPAILFSLTVHEFAHAYTALLLGDRTAKWSGRLTLNPLAHLDPVGTLALIITQRFGWAKPVPINPGYFRDRRRGVLLVSLAGPGSNLILAIAFASAYKVLFAVAGHGMFTTSSFLYYTAVAIRFAVLVNLGLCFFNLIPVPPLDGSKILSSLLSGPRARAYYQFEQYAPFILLLLVLTPAAGIILGPIITAVYRAIM